MKLRLGHLAAGAAMVGALGLGGAQLAWAQDDPTTTTEDPAVTDDGTTTDDGSVTKEDCNHGERGSRDQDNGDDADATAL